MWREPEARCAPARRSRHTADLQHLLHPDRGSGRFHHRSGTAGRHPLHEPALSDPHGGGDPRPPHRGRGDDRRDGSAAGAGAQAGRRRRRACVRHQPGAAPAAYSPITSWWRGASPSCMPRSGTPPGPASTPAPPGTPARPAWRWTRCTRNTWPRARRPRARPAPYSSWRPPSLRRPCGGPGAQVGSGARHRGPAGLRPPRPARSSVVGAGPRGGQDFVDGPRRT